MAIYSLGERRGQIPGAHWDIADGYMRRVKLVKQQFTGAAALTQKCVLAPAADSQAARLTFAETKC
jgi:hypothetical protein